MTSQTITEATAHQLLMSIQELKISLAVTSEKLQVQSEWNQEQKRTNAIVSNKLSEIEKSDVDTQGRIKKLEDWKNWVNNILTAVLVSVLLSVVAAVLYFTYGAHP